MKGEVNFFVLSKKKKAKLTGKRKLEPLLDLEYSKFPISVRYNLTLIF